MLLEKMSAVDGHASLADRTINSMEQLEKENNVLKRRLQDANSSIEDMGRKMELQMNLQKTRTRQLIAGWKIRLQESDQKVLQCAREKDAQFTELVSELMYIEGCLKKERRQIVEKLSERDLKIRQLELTLKKQQRQIDALNKANENLIGSLHEMNLESPDPSPPSSPIPEFDPGEPLRGSDSEMLPVNPHLRQFLKPQGQVPKQRASTVGIMPSRRDRRRGVPNGSILAHNNNKPQLAVNHPQDQQYHQHRVRFQDEVFEQDTPIMNHLDVEPIDTRTRKHSLPVFRLPTDEDESIPV